MGKRGRPASKYLTAREREVLVCLCRGMTQGETATHFCITGERVNRIIGRAKQRLGARTVEQLVVLALRDRSIGIRTDGVTVVLDTNIPPRYEEMW